MSIVSSACDVVLARLACVANLGDITVLFGQGVMSVRALLLASTSWSRRACSIIGPSMVCWLSGLHRGEACYVAKPTGVLLHAVVRLGSHGDGTGRRPDTDKMGSACWPVIVASVLP